MFKYTLIKRPLWHTWMIVIVCLCGASSMWGITSSLVTNTLDIWQAELHQYLSDLFFGYTRRLSILIVGSSCHPGLLVVPLIESVLFPTYIHPTSPYCIFVIQSTFFQGIPHLHQCFGLRLVPVWVNSRYHAICCVNLAFSCFFWCFPGTWLQAYQTLKPHLHLKGV